MPPDNWLSGCDFNVAGTVSNSGMSSARLTEFAAATRRSGSGRTGVREMIPLEAELEEMKDSRDKVRQTVAGKRPALDIELVDTIISAYRGRAQTLLGPHRGNPVDVLVATILSQATSDVQSERAFRNLKQAFPTWEEVICADPRDVEAAIAKAGLAREKARNLQAALKKVRDDMGRIDLQKLAGLDAREAMEYLLSLPGVGPKTAACTLLFGFDVPVFPVDTHILRIAKRLGIIPPATSAEKAQVILNEMIPADRMLEFHTGLIEHGRRVCKKRKPLCERCAISKWCARREA